MRDILFLCQFFYPEYVSSATLPYDTAEVLVKNGFSVSVLCGYPHEYNTNKKIKKSEIYNGIKIRRLRYLQLSREGLLGRVINYFSFTFAVLLNLPNIRKFKSVIVYSNPPILPLIAAIANKLFDVKIVFVCYDVYPEIALKTESISYNSSINSIMRWINKIFFHRVDTVVALSNEMKNYLIEHRNPLTSDQTVVIPNWYDDIRIGKQFLKNDNICTVSYFGNLGTCQDLDTILGAVRILRQNKKIEFVFAGHGNKMKLLRNIAEKEELNNVSIHDFLHGDNYIQALRKSDICLVSLSEGVSNLAVPSKTYAYMMSGKPIIAIMENNTDIASDLINNNAGYVVSVGDVKRLTTCILNLTEDVVLRTKMGENSRNIFLKKYTKQKCTYNYVKLFQKLLKDK